MRALDTKLLRDLRHMWGQALAIALVIAAGVATLILAIGAYRSLDETRRAYYERYRFADLFAQARRVPDPVRERLAAIPGVAAVEARVVRGALLDIDGFPEPASGRLISLPPEGAPLLNDLFVRSGRLPAPGRDDEVAINEKFAAAHGLRPGATLKAILNGRKRTLTVVGIALSPEFIYAVGTADLIPDDRRFGILWLPHQAAAAAFDLDGAFNDVAVRLQPDAAARDVIAAMDRMLEPYGGIGAHDRGDQPSHAFLDAELQQLRGMATIIPPIFLAVAAFLLNMTLARLIALEREQIGLLKALGYGALAIAVHYLKLVCVIAATGIAIGFLAGTWLGRGMTEIYGEFFHFPFLVFLTPAEIYVIAGGVSLAAAIAGALRAVRAAAGLPPAVAMAPPLPVRYRRAWIGEGVMARRLSQPAIMIVRHLTRFPTRAALTVIGIASSATLLVVSLFSFDAVEVMIDVTYFRTMRQDLTVTFAEIRPARIVREIQRLDGVLAAEVQRSVPVTLRHGPRHRRLALTGLPPGTDLQRLLDRELRPLAVPGTGIALTETLAGLLGAGLGDAVLVEVHDGHRPRFQQTVTAIAQGYIGLGAYMALEPLNTALGDGRAVSAANIMVDGARSQALNRTLKDMPAVSGVASLTGSLQTFRDTLAQNITIMMTVYVLLSGIVTFGVVYNSARIQLSERGRELASLRVLGFTRGEVSRILLGEIAVLVALAIPLGWAMGHGLARLVVEGLETELYRIPFVVSRRTYAIAALAVVAAAALSALIVRRRIDRLDLIAVLKTRE